MKRSRRFLISVPMVLACAGLVWFALMPPREDPRTISDKEGRYLPAFSLREMAHAMHLYQEKHGRLPPHALYSPEGVPLLSWRVLLLPFIEQEDLYHQFKLNEPWDSPHNYSLLPKIPYTYSPLPGNPPLEPFTTVFQVFVGEGAAFEGREGLLLKEDFPRRSFTILIVEAEKGVPWTKPEDIPFTQGQPLPKLGRFFKGRFQTAKVSGETLAHFQDIDPEALQGAILRNYQGPWLWK